MSQCHYMQKDGGPIVKVNLNDWAQKRRAGFKFSTRQEFEDQVQGAAPDRDEDVGGDFPTMDNTKAEIMDYARDNSIDFNRDDTKADILAAIGG